MTTTEKTEHASAGKTHGSETALGKNVLWREGAAKLCGKAQYVDDLPHGGVWVGGTMRAEVPHARLLGVRSDERFDWDRVVMVTASDIPGENVVPVVLRDQLSHGGLVVPRRSDPTNATRRGPVTCFRRSARRRIC